MAQHLGQPWGKCSREKEEREQEGKKDKDQEEKKEKEEKKEEEELEVKEKETIVHLTALLPLEGSHVPTEHHPEF